MPNEDTRKNQTVSEDTAAPSRAVESPQISENRSAQLPQPVPQSLEQDDTKETPKKSTSRRRSTAQKTASRKRSAAKKAPAKKAAAKKSAATKKASAKKSTSLTQVAEEILAGSTKWGTGREQFDTLLKEGYDPTEVRNEVHRLRVERMLNNS